ncbi:hypothetical protein GEMRC1_013827 [Eukaryota sp. GEM-RC1]
MYFFSFGKNTCRCGDCSSHLSTCVHVSIAIGVAVGYEFGSLAGWLTIYGLSAIAHSIIFKSPALAVSFAVWLRTIVMIVYFDNDDGLFSLATLLDVSSFLLCFTIGGAIVNLSPTEGCPSDLDSGSYQSVLIPAVLGLLVFKLMFTPGLWTQLSVDFSYCAVILTSFPFAHNF